MSKSEETDGDRKGVNLDELQHKVEGLLSLLKDRQPGLSSWNKSMYNHISDINALTSIALDGP